jgi:hypothetical protein
VRGRGFRRWPGERGPPNSSFRRAAHMVCPPQFRRPLAW